MDDQVRLELTDLLRTGGRNICTTPRMVSILLRERCPDAEKAVSEIEHALTTGCVQAMLETVGPVDEEELAARLVNESGMSSEQARWVIESWVQAIAAADAPPPLGRDWSAWNRLNVKEATAGGGGAYQRAIAELIVVGLAGAAGALAPSLFMMVDGGTGPNPAWREALQDIPHSLQVVVLLTLSILGGFTGGLLGWMSGPGRSGSYDPNAGISVGRLVLSSLAAAFGAGIGVLAGVEVLGLIGVMLGALIGAGLGLLLTGMIARFWW
jgi:hypothetical protein